MRGFMGFWYMCRLCVFLWIFADACILRCINTCITIQLRAEHAFSRESCVLTAELRWNVIRTCIFCSDAWITRFSRGPSVFLLQIYVGMWHESTFYATTHGTRVSARIVCFDYRIALKCDTNLYFLQRCVNHAFLAWAVCILLQIHVVMWHEAVFSAVMRESEFVSLKSSILRRLVWSPCTGTLYISI